jgi:hypothetical protein
MKLSGVCPTASLAIFKHVYIHLVIQKHKEEKINQYENCLSRCDFFSDKLKE